LGRWFSVDPWEQKYPYISPYASMHNNPIGLNDIKGLGPKGGPLSSLSPIGKKILDKTLVYHERAVNIDDPADLVWVYRDVNIGRFYATHYNTKTNEHGDVGEVHEVEINGELVWTPVVPTAKEEEAAKQVSEKESSFVSFIKFLDETVSPFGVTCYGDGTGSTMQGSEKGNSIKSYDINEIKENFDLALDQMNDDPNVNGFFKNHDQRLKDFEEKAKKDMEEMLNKSLEGIPNRGRRKITDEEKAKIIAQGIVVFSDYIEAKIEQKRQENIAEPLYNIPTVPQGDTSWVILKENLGDNSGANWYFYHQGGNTFITDGQSGDTLGGYAPDGTVFQSK
jgi:hypothetical protein